MVFEAQYAIIARDIADGVSRLTAAHIMCCQLPVNRATSSTFDMGTHIQQQLDSGSAPDYLMIDANSSQTAAFDKHSGISTQELAVYEEQKLPARFDLTLNDGTMTSYELISFCNFERAGISAVPIG